MQDEGRGKEKEKKNRIELRKQNVTTRLSAFQGAAERYPKLFQLCRRIARSVDAGRIKKDDMATPNQSAAHSQGSAQGIVQ